MAARYREVPANWDDIKDKVTTLPEQIADFLLYKYDKVFFYDTCSFREHSNLLAGDVDFILDYIKQEHGTVVITRCILMELASESGRLNPEYINLINRMVHIHGLKVIVMNEEDLFTVLSEPFSSTEKINEYLMWAVRMLKIPTSTIRFTLDHDDSLRRRLVDGKGLASKNLYEEFFKEVRSQKVASDNLGEELLAICLHIMSHVPGTHDYKYHVLTEDKGARAVINDLFEKTNEQFAGSQILIYSTPRLVQRIIELGLISDKNAIARILGNGINRKIKVYAALPHEFVFSGHTFDAAELAELLLTPSGIDVRF